MSTPESRGPDGPPTEREDRPTVLSVIRGLQSGAIEPKGLSIDARRACVEHLTGEGYSIVEIAEILKASERTVARDRRAIHEANAIQRDPRLVEEIVGRLAREAELSISRMRRVTREKRTPASVKVDAEHRCYQVFSDLVQSLQRLGYLPTAAHEIRTDLTHHVDDPPGFDEMLTEISQLELVIEKESDGDIQRRLNEIKKNMAQYAAHEQIEQITDSIQQENEADGEGA